MGRMEACFILLRWLFSFDYCDFVESSKLIHINFQDFGGIREEIREINENLWECVCKGSKNHLV